MSKLPENFGLHIRVFDWSTGKNEPGAPSYRFWLDGEEIPDKMHLWRAVIPAEAGREVRGLLYFYKTDEQGAIIAERDEGGNPIGPDWYTRRGRVRWEYA